MLPPALFDYNYKPMPFNFSCLFPGPTAVCTTDEYLSCFLSFDGMYCRDSNRDHDNGLHYTARSVHCCTKETCIFPERTVDYGSSDCPAMCEVEDFSRELSSSMLTYESIHTWTESKESAMRASYINSVNTKSRVVKEDMEWLFASIQRAKKSIISAKQDWKVCVIRPYRIKLQDLF